MLNTGPHSCIWGGGLQLSSAGTDYSINAECTVCYRPSICLSVCSWHVRDTSWISQNCI